MSTAHELSYEECADLLGAGSFGRMVVNRPTGPEIVPVNYVVVDGAVLVRTSPGSLLDRFADRAALAFEVDDVDHAHWRGWSVVARGRGERVTYDRLSEAERSGPGPEPWITRDQETWIRLTWVTLTGRRVGEG